jgi:hypothetical protein
MYPVPMIPDRYSAEIQNKKKIKQKSPPSQKMHVWFAVM